MRRVAVRIVLMLAVAVAGLPAEAAPPPACTGAPAHACAALGQSRTFFASFARGPQTVIVEGEAWQDPSGREESLTCVKAFGPGVFVVNCFRNAPMSVQISPDLSTASVRGSYVHPKLGRVTVAVTATATQAPRVRTGHRVIAAAWCTGTSGDSTAPAIVRDAAASGSVTFEKSIGRFAAPKAGGPALLGLSHRPAAASGTPCSQSTGPGGAFFRQLTCNAPLCTGVERGVSVAFKRGSTTLTLIALHEEGTERMEHIQRQGSVPDATGLECYAVAVVGSASMTCQPGLLGARIDPALRGASMRATIPASPLGAIRVSLDFATPASPQTGNLPASHAQVECGLVGWYSETKLAEGRSAVTGTVASQRSFGVVRATASAPATGRMWSKLYATGFVPPQAKIC